MACHRTKHRIPLKYEGKSPNTPRLKILRNQTFEKITLLILRPLRNKIGGNEKKMHEI